MAEYIEREALSCVSCTHYEACKVWVNHCNELLCGFGVEGMDFPFVCAVPNRLCERYQPAADVVEVRHGEWVDKFNRNRMATQSFCSVCGGHSGIGGIEINRHKPYCPNCGAKMDGRGEK